jgi:adenylosuccinate lyase
MRREDAYAIVQELAMKGWEGGATFRELVASDRRITDKLSKSEIERCFDPSRDLQYVDFIFKRVGLL